MGAVFVFSVLSVQDSCTCIFLTSEADFPAYCSDQCCVLFGLVEMNNSILITAAVWLQRRQSHQVGWEVRLLVDPDSNILTTIGGIAKKVFTDTHCPQKMNLTDTGDSMTCHRLSPTGQSYCWNWINLPLTDYLIHHLRVTVTPFLCRKLQKHPQSQFLQPGP